MSRSETESYLWALSGTIDAVLECLDGLTASELLWRPEVPDGGVGPGAPPGEGGGANTLFAIATHVMGNAEQNIVEFLGGEPVDRHRREEFLAEGASLAPLRERWRAMEQHFARVLAAVSRDELERERDHPNRGRITGREVALSATRHANEHLGEAQLIRQLILARREA